MLAKAVEEWLTIYFSNKGVGCEVFPVGDSKIFDHTGECIRSSKLRAEGESGRAVELESRKVCEACRKGTCVTGFFCCKSHTHEAVSETN